MLIALVILVGVLLPAIQPRRHRGSRQLKDSTQIRGLVQACVIWAQNNNEKYPLPSAIDVGNRTVPEIGESKDTTANILSLLIYIGNISPDYLISPSEVNTAQVQLMTNYEYTNPKNAVDPKNAMWDPRFRGTPIDARLAGAAPGIGNNSYAHAMPFGSRRKAWADTYSSTEAVFASRGPTYAADDFAPHPAKGAFSLVPGTLGRGSNTLLIHGGRSTWEGNVGYNDGRVQFETAPAPKELTYQRAVAGGKPVATPDNLFVSESDEAEDGKAGTGADKAPWLLDRAVNAYLRPIADRRLDGPVTVWRD